MAESEVPTNETTEDSREEHPTENSDDERGHFPDDVSQYVINLGQEKVKIPREGDGWSAIYKCPEVTCIYSHKDWAHVREHYKTHSGEKPYQCKFCDKRFTQRGNCMAHIRTHDDRFKFKCEVSECDAKFAQYRYLKKHSAVEHNIKMPNNVGQYYYIQMNGSPWCGFDSSDDEEDMDHTVW